MSISAPTVTGWSNFWGLTADAYTMQNFRSSHERRLGMVFGRHGYRGIRKVERLITGTAVGQTATDTYARVSAPAGLTEASSLGGARTIDTITSVARATVTADKTYMETVLDKVFGMNPAISTYPTDASGNGGGGKAGR